MTATLAPTTDLVAVAWLASVPGLSSGMVATKLPADNSNWAAAGFVQIIAVGGTPELYVPVAAPVVGVSCWAVNPNSSKPPWGKANHLAELIRLATYDHQNVPRALSLPANFGHARVTAAYFVSEPKRIPGDPANYARFDVDLALRWHGSSS